MSSIAICVPTLKRPVGLERLLQSLAGQVVEQGCKVKVSIVDNDRERSAEPVVNRVREAFPWQIEYEVEERPGIPFVRNRLVDLAGSADFIAFIDDDEEATSNWLYELMKVQQAYDADVVMGPVEPVYEEPPPNWVLEGGFHASGRFSDGLTESNLITWNVLLRKSLFDQPGIAFEERMALTGGTDVLLGRVLRQRGIVFHWAGKALVREINPPERAKLNWILRRRFRSGTAEVLIRRYANEPRYRIHLLGFAVKMAIVGMLKSLTAIWRGKPALFKGIGYLFQSGGVFSGLSGFAYLEYRKAHEKKLSTS